MITTATPETKICSKCGPQPWGNFEKDKRTRTGLQSWCKDCRKEKSAAYYASLTDDQKTDRYYKSLAGREMRQEFILRYFLDHPCADCDEDDPIVLEFDHVRGAKKGNVSDMVNRGTSINILEDEIAKCEVVCRNCHSRRETYRGYHRKLRVLEEILS
jgi:hypothetical protein